MRLPLFHLAAAHQRFLAAGLFALATWLLPASLRAENVYIMQLGLNGIYSVDVAPGGPSTRLTPTPAAGTQGYTLAVRPSDGMLFYLDSDQTNPNLWRWNPDTPTVPPVLLGTPGATTTGVVRLGFDGAGNLLAMNTNSSVWTLDQSTGGILSTTPLSGDLPTSSGDLCLNTSTGVLYMVALQSVYTVTSAGVSTRLGNITGPGWPTGVNGYVTGCAFTRDGSMLISLYDDNGWLRRVNLTTLVADRLPVASGVDQIGDLATAPQRSADLRLSKTANTTTPGSTVTFTVRVDNDGPQRAADVRVRDILPAGLTLVSSSVSQGTLSGNEWRAGVLRPGTFATWTITANVSSASPITNTAEIIYSDEYDPDSVPNNQAAGEDDQASVTVTPRPDLRITKTAAGSFAVNVEGSYTLTVRNDGPAPTSGTYTVADALPPGLAFVSADGPGWNCSNASGTVTCSSSAVIGANAANPNSITLRVMPSAAAGTQVSNTAAVAGGNEPANNAGNNSGTAVTAVCNATCPDLRMEKSLNVGSLSVGGTGAYTLRVTNAGGLGTTAPFTVVDTLPAGLRLGAAPAAGTGWSCPAATPTTNVANGTIVSCTRNAALAPNVTTATITFPVTVTNAAVPQVTNTASVSGGGEPAATQGNNSASLTTPVLDFDLVVSKTRTGGGSFQVGANSSYTFTVRNIGTRATTGAYTFTDVLPPGLTIRSTVPTNWTVPTDWACASNVDGQGANRAGSTRISCTSSATIGVGAAATTVIVPVTVAAAAAPAVSNTVNVSGVQEASANTGNNAHTEVTPVNAVDLAVTKSHNGTFAVGATESYTITVTNIGAVPTSGTITVRDTLPAGLTYLNSTGTGTGWTCSAAGQVVTCTRTTSVAASRSAPPIVLNVRPTVGGTVTNTVTVSGGNEPTGYADNNAASDVTLVSVPPGITKSFAPASIPAGGTSTMTIAISNPSNSGVASMTGLSFSDPFPAGMSIANPPNLVNTCGGSVSPGTSQGDTVLALTGGATAGPGTSCSIQVSVTSTTTRTNTTGEVRSTNSGTGGTASAQLTVTAPMGNAVLTKLSAPSVVGVGETAVLTFTLINKNSASNNLAFRDTFHPNVVLAAAGTVSNTCTDSNNNDGNRAVITANAGANSVQVTGLDLDSGASCSFAVRIRSNVAGTYPNTSTNISNVQGTLSVASVSDVFEVRAVRLAKSFAPDSILAGTTSTMSFVLTNGAGLPEQNGVAFVETLPPGVTLAAAPAPSQCGGAVSGAAGGATLAVSGVSLAAGQASCTITAEVTSNTAGTYVNDEARISGLSANLDNQVDATLRVFVPLPTLQKTNNQDSISPGDTTTYVITVGNETDTTFSGTSAVVLRDPPVANLALTGASCEAQGGASCPGGSSATWIASLRAPGGLALPALPPDGSVMFTLEARLTGNPVGALTNTATATTNGASVSAQDTDTIVYPGLVHAKAVMVLSDPVNGTTQPKYIPGAEAVYAITVTNAGLGRVDTDTLVLRDGIPTDTVLFVGDLGGDPAGPVSFAEAGTGLTFDFTGLGANGDDLEFSSDNGSTWTYVPVPDANGYDAAVTHIRMRPKGRMAGWSGSGPHPAFTLTFKVRLN